MSDGLDAFAQQGEERAGRRRVTLAGAPCRANGPVDSGRYRENRHPWRSRVADGGRGDEANPEPLAD